MHAARSHFLASFRSFAARLDGLTLAWPRRGGLCGRETIPLSMARGLGFVAVVGCAGRIDGLMRWWRAMDGFAVVGLDVSRASVMDSLGRCMDSGHNWG
jgi:hypothetical protein